LAQGGGYNLGKNLNQSEDALEFYAFHDTWINPYLAAHGRLTPWQSARMKESFHAAVARHIPEPERRGMRWGWKAPRSIYLLPFLQAEFPQLKFIHLVRDGRDMAISSNQNQMRKHGPAILRSSERFFRSVPEGAILLWDRVNLRAAEFGESRLSENYLRVRFEDLCAEPAKTIGVVASFLDVAIDPKQFATEIIPPETLQRWKTCPDRLISKLEAQGANSLRKFGYLS
jgi:sulfotransferase family protein